MAEAEELKYTSRQFIESWPLYVKFKTESLPIPESISRQCGPCEQNTTWVAEHQNSLGYPFGVWDVTYLCILCKGQRLRVLIAEAESRQVPGDTPRYHCVSKDRTVSTAFDRNRP